jgi:hypothetical protein
MPVKSLKTISKALRWPENRENMADIHAPSDKGLFSSKLLYSLRRFQEKKVRPLPSCDYDANEQQNLKILSPNQRLNQSQPIKTHALRIGSIRDSPSSDF